MKPSRAPPEPFWILAASVVAGNTVMALTDALKWLHGTPYALLGLSIPILPVCVGCALASARARHPLQLWGWAAGAAGAVAFIGAVVDSILNAPGDLPLLTLLILYLVYPGGAVFVSAGLVGTLALRRGRHRRGKLGLCPACGYDLSGLEGRPCPECGRGGISAPAVPPAGSE